MRLSVLLALLAVATASAGELKDQFPEHPRKRGFSSTDPWWYPARTIKQIGIEHTPCYGRCPVFTFIVNSDGTFRYRGEEFAKRRGNWHGSVDPSALPDVLRYAAEMHYFDLADVYTSNDTDLPGAYTMLTTKTRKKIVYNYGRFGPARLGALEDMMDGLLTGAKWKRD